MWLTGELGAGPASLAPCAVLEVALKDTAEPQQDAGFLLAAPRCGACCPAPRPRPLSVRSTP